MATRCGSRPARPRRRSEAARARLLALESQSRGPGAAPCARDASAAGESVWSATLARLALAVDPLSVSIVVSAPRELVFDYLQDVANHAEFTDHYLVDWHLTRIDSVGRGAGARFRVKIPRNRFSWADITFAEVDPPHRIVEVGSTGKNNRIRTLGVWDLSPGASGTTRVRFTLETVPATLSDRLMEGLGARSWTRRKNARAMRRLRAILERGEDRGRRVTVARG
jgi:uncharacterized protein YndB with AHSA1/START domain